jgi:nucleotide-binding universal stress UspA family protein
MECPQSHHLLVAVDESENSRRAVDYLAEWTACNEAVRVVLAHVVKEPSSDVLPDQDERDQYTGQKTKAAEGLLERTRKLLESRGVPGERMGSRVLSCAPPETVVDAILAEKERGDYDTIVLGRRGMSKREEYIFGSVTNRLIREVSDISVWVVP